MKPVYPSALRAAPAPGFAGGILAGPGIVSEDSPSPATWHRERPGLAGSRRTGAIAFGLVLLLAWLLLTPGARGSTDAPVLVLGDSISAAYGMALEQGWVALLEHRLVETGFDGRVVNASISGDTSAGGLRRLPALLEEHRPQLVVLELGGNDGLRGYPTNALRDNLTAMAELALAAGARVLILPMEIPPNYGPRYTRAFRASFREATEASGATLGPFILDGIATEDPLMQDDGIHPTAAAQAMIADLVEPVVLELLDASPAVAE